MPNQLDSFASEKIQELQEFADALLNPPKDCDKERLAKILLTRSDYDLGEKELLEYAEEEYVKAVLNWREANIETLTAAKSLVGDPPYQIES